MSRKASRFHKADLRKGSPRGARISRRFYVLVGLLVGSIACVAVSQTSPGAIQEVRVLGVELTPPSVVRAAARVNVGQPMTNFISSSVADRVGLIGTLSDVEVRRNWVERTVDIAVVEKSPILSTPAETGHWLIAADGTVMAQVESPSEAVDAIEGPPTTQIVGEPAVGYPASLIELLGELETTALTAERLRVDGQGILEAEFEPLGSVILGTTSDMEAKISALETLSTRIDLTCIESVDVSVASLPTVTRDRACEAALAPPVEQPTTEG